MSMSATPKTIAIVGASGKVGYATVQALRDAGGIHVKAILRDGSSQGARLTRIGCDVAVIADLADSEALADAISGSDAVQVILPPSPQADDPAVEMRGLIESIAVALERARPARVLAISDYGAHVPHDIGMPTMCRAFEERLRRLDGGGGSHKIFLRSAEHMQNWARIIPAAIESGVLPSFLDPADRLVPTISAPDLGFIAAELLLQPLGGSVNGAETVHAEGPRRYSPGDVAAALGELSGREVEVAVVPRPQWEDVLGRVMPASLAELLIKANDAQNQGGLVDVETDGVVRYGKTELIDALRPLIHPN